MNSQTKGTLGMDQTERFWSRVDKSGECWTWTGARRPQGYGIAYFNGRTQRAHRVAVEIATGTPAPAGMDVCHRCDNPPCVNPAHLFVGTRQDNLSDMVAKGRSGKGPGLLGERHPNSILTEEGVRQIRALYALGVQGVWIAREFNIRTSTVSAVAKRTNWKEVA